MGSTKGAKTATELATPKPSPISGVAPPKERQFGQPNGNPRNPGGWKKEDTPRYKIEQMTKLRRIELTQIINDQDAPEFERKIARFILQGDWRTIEGMINQAYGQPKQRLEVEPVQPKPLIDLTEGKKDE